MHCHDRRGPAGPKCTGKDNCPLGVEHPPNNSNKAFAVGCGMCRDLKIKDGKELDKTMEEQMKEQKEKLDKLKKEIVDF